MATLNHACGCRLETEGAMVIELHPCSEHGGFAIVQRAMRTARDALREAHEQLPPGPLPPSPKEAA